MQILKSHLRSLVVFSLVFGSACIRFYRVPTEAELGSHRVSVRPQCHNASTHSVNHTEEDGSSSIRFYEFTCGDTKVLVKGNMLSVNGKAYGTLNAGDKIAVDYGKVRVNSEIRAEVR